MAICDSMSTIEEIRALNDLNAYFITLDNQELINKYNLIYSRFIDMDKQLSLLSQAEGEK